MRAESTVLNHTWLISVFSLPSQAEWDGVSAISLGVLLCHPFLPCLPLPFFLSCCEVCEPQSHAEGLCEPLYTEEKISEHKKFLCPGSLVPPSLVGPCFLAQGLWLSGWVWLIRIKKKKDHEKLWCKWWKMSVLCSSVIIFVFLIYAFICILYIFLQNMIWTHPLAHHFHSHSWSRSWPPVSPELSSSV